MFASVLSAVSAGPLLTAGGLVTDAGVPTGWGMFASEFLGTLILIVLGCGVVANVVTSAMSTNIVNTVGEMTFRSRPRLSRLRPGSVSGRDFIRPESLP